MHIVLCWGDGRRWTLPSFVRFPHLGFAQATWSRVWPTNSSITGKCQTTDPSAERIAEKLFTAADLEETQQEELMAFVGLRLCEGVRPSQIY